MDRWRAVEEPTGRRRLDVVVAQRYGVARNRAQGWIADGRVRLDGRRAKSSAPVPPGATIECDPPRAEDLETLVPEEGPLEIVHEDEDLVVVDKPPDLAMHPGAGRATGTLAHRLLGRYPELAGVGGPGRPGIVHRLDLGTSGVLVVARTASAYDALSRAFAERRTDKTYVAVAYGRPDPGAGRIDLPVGRNPRQRKEMAVVARGREARTSYATLATAEGVSAVSLDLETGRTHQIRVHLKALGHPIVGDPTYGEARWKGVPRPGRDVLRRYPRTALHAWRLAFDHPRTGRAASFTVDPPADLEGLWSGLGGEASLATLLRGGSDQDQSSSDRGV